MVYSHVPKRPTLFYATHYPTFYVLQMIGHKTALHNVIVVQIWKVKTFTSCIRSTCKRYIYSDDQIVLFEKNTSLVEKCLKPNCVKIKKRWILFLYMIFINYLGSIWIDSQL